MRPGSSPAHVVCLPRITPDSAHQFISGDCKCWSGSVRYRETYKMCSVGGTSWRGLKTNAIDWTFKIYVYGVTIFANLHFCRFHSDDNCINLKKLWNLFPNWLHFQAPKMLLSCKWTVKTHEKCSVFSWKDCYVNSPLLKLFHGTNNSIWFGMAWGWAYNETIPLM